MKNILKKVAGLALVAGLVFGMFGCSDPSAPEAPEFTPDTMVKITGCSTGDFYISNTELTYAKWYEVYQWAVENGYIFQDLGREGRDGIDGAEPTKNSKQPVTMVSWRDAVVWCNAASEMEDLTPVYEYDGDVLREAENNYEQEGTNTANTTKIIDGKAENSTVRSEANGYRLPTREEWEYAAKGGADYTYSGSDNIDDVAWYWENSEEKSHDVGTKNANGYELYDMSGNVSEMIWDYSGNKKNRYICGGCYYPYVSSCTISDRYTNSCDHPNRLNGFRVCRNAN